VSERKQTHFNDFWENRHVATVTYLRNSLSIVLYQYENISKASHSYTFYPFLCIWNCGCSSFWKGICTSKIFTTVQIENPAA